MSTGTGAGVLYVCATPIGNLEDVTLRLLRVLKEVHLIAAEDTRHTRRLCSRYGITTPLVSCHEGNEEQRAVEINRLLAQGRSVAYVSDAGTPAVSDPGSRLVRAVLEAGGRVVPIPGPSAVTTALSVSGFRADAFLALGFLPRKGQRRSEALQRIAAESLPVVLFEAPHRIQATLGDLLAVTGPQRPIWVGRELTKSFESTYRGTMGEIWELVSADPIRGEYTIVVGPGPAGEAPGEEKEAGRSIDDVALARQVDDLVAAGLSPSEAMRQTARMYGLTRREVYRRLKIDQ